MGHRCPLTKHRLQPQSICDAYRALFETQNWTVKPMEESSIQKDRVTLPKILKEKGYYSACVGKLGLTAMERRGKAPTSVIG